ncbi:MAG: histidine kinase [Bacteroidota bacterium]
MSRNIIRRFLRWNALALLLLGLFFWIRPSTASENFVFWPGAYFLSLWIISQVLPLLYSFFLSDHSTPQFRTLMVALTIGTGHFLLTGALILLLERLFGFEEHYELNRLADYARDSWHYAIEGSLIALFYLIVMYAMSTKERLEEERELHQGALADLRTLDLNMLKSELNPHFLYNAMNSISMKVRIKENKVAIRMIAALTDLLRTVLSSRKVHLVSLDEEISYLSKYLSIEEARFGATARMELSFPDETLTALVPPLILQPLVENAFKHGAPSTNEQAYIRVAAEKTEDQLVVQVHNAGSGDQKIVTELGAVGIGLPNVVHRLRQLYGNHFRFQIVNHSKGVICKITLPFQT